LKHYFLIVLLLVLSVLSGHASTLNQSCREILKQSSDRDQKALKAEILETGEKLLRSYFPHSDFHNLSKSEKINFSLTAKHEIIETMISQGTVVLPVPQSTAFAILGGKSRIGRVAHNLGRQGIFLLIDFETLYSHDIDGFYSPSRRVITLGLEDALFPNQISYSLMHEATHALLDQKVLFIPRIYDSLDTETYLDFSIDEVITYSKQMLQMVNHNIVAQNSRRTNAARATILFSAGCTMRDLSIRILAKKHGLLHIVEFLKKAEENPSLIKMNENEFVIIGLDPEIALSKSGFLGDLPQNLKQKVKATRVVIEEVIRIAEMAVGE
jgi:hypothetical protein